MNRHSKLKVILPIWLFLIAPFLFLIGALRFFSHGDPVAGGLYVVTAVAAALVAIAAVRIV